MNNKLFAMDTSFYTSLGSYSFESRCEMLAELGYDAMYLTYWDNTHWNDAMKLAEVKQRYGLDAAGLYIAVDIHGDEHHEGNAEAMQLLEQLEGCPIVELSVVASRATGVSDASEDAHAAALLQRLLEIAERRGIQLLLYPHIGHWLERVEDAVRLCRAVEHPNLGLTFPAYHWFAADGTGLQQKLELCLPYLRLVNICGSTRMEGYATIEPLDAGELDNFALLAHLHKLGYTGPIGLQGYSVGGDVYAKLRRSLAAYKDMAARIAAHPDWSGLGPKLPWM